MITLICCIWNQEDYELWHEETVKKCFQYLEYELAE